MENIKDKINYYIEVAENYLNNNSIKDFFIKYKYVILISFFVGILINAVDIFTIKFGLDSEIYAYKNDSSNYYDSQRYGSYLLYHLLPFARFHIISQIIGVLALIFAGLLIVSHHKISNTRKLLFVLIFITYPTWTFLQYFYFQSAYNFIAILLCVIAYRVTENNKNIILYLVSILLLIIGISSYQSNFAIFLSVVMINATLYFLQDKDYKKAVKIILKNVIILCLSMAIYYLLIKLLSRGFSGYHSQFFRYNADNFFDIFHKIIFQFIPNTLISSGYIGGGTANITFSIILIISTIIILFTKFNNVKERLFFLLLIILFISSIFSLNILLGDGLPLRSNIYLALYGSFAIILLSLISSKKIIILFASAISTVIIIYHSYFITQYQMGSYLRYSYDKVFAISIMEKIYAKYPETYRGKYKLALYETDRENLYGKIHPMFTRKDILGNSLFFWDGGNLVFAAYRVVHFMQLFGFNMEITNAGLNGEMKKVAENMPAYPNNDCIELYENTIIVKLK